VGYIVQGYPAVMASDNMQGPASEAVLPVSHLANPMLAGSIAAQQPQQHGAATALLPLAAAASGLPGIAAGPHPNPSTGPCPAVFVANIGHIGSDRDLKDLFSRFAPRFRPRDISCKLKNIDEWRLGS